MPVLSGHLAESVRRADEQLAETSNQLADLQAFSQYVIDSLLSGLATTDIDGRVLTFNRAAESITRVKAADAVGRSIAAVLQFPRDLAGLFGAREGRPKLPRVEFAFTRGDDLQLELGLSTALLITPRGETGFVFTFQDVTNPASRSAKRASSSDSPPSARWRPASRTKSAIPLASMSGSIQILRQELPLTAEQSQLMDIVLRESDRLNETIRSFLAYAKPQRLSTARVDVRQIITDTACLLQNNAELSEAHQIDVDVPVGTGVVRRRREPVPAESSGISRPTRSARCPKAESCGCRSHGAEDANSPGLMVIRVEDQGVGIAPEELDGIFQPFRGAFERGTGLGLAIVHRIVSDYGGEVHVTSERGVGTRVEVTLPLAVPAPADARAPELT